MRFLVVAAVVALLAALAGAPAAGARQGRQVLYPDDAMYPRVIRIEHGGSANGRLVVSLTSEQQNGDGVGVILESTDAGATFRRIATIADPDGRGGRGLCCGTLFELPRPLGTLPAGTLLWAATTGWEVDTEHRRVKQRLWQSRDQGRTWTFLADMATSPNQFNAWEPELSMSADGQLVVHWADESGKPHHDQKLVRARSADGVTWSAPQDTVAHRDFFVRPGMPGVRQLPDGTFFLVYEVCNLEEPLCSVYFRTSRDGWHYGDPLQPGTGVRTADGKYPRHTPTVDVTPAGTILLVSEMLVTSDGDPAPNNGRALLVNDRGGAGPWREIPAPVEVPGVNNEGCRNFSPSLLASTDGTTVLEIATDLHDGVCTAYYASGPVG